MKNVEQIKKWLENGSINIFGKPLAGKDSQCKILAELLSGNVLGAGEIFRGSDMPDSVKECMKNGNLVPTQDFIDIVLPFLNQERLMNKPLILSSVGRWHGEEEGVIGAVKSAGHPIKIAIYLDLSDEELLNRLHATEQQAGRADRQEDSKEALKNRLNEFDAKTKPVLEYYKNLELLLTVNGTGTKEQVTNNIIFAINNFIK